MQTYLAAANGRSFPTDGETRLTLSVNNILNAAVHDSLQRGLHVKVHLGLLTGFACWPSDSPVFRACVFSSNC